MVNIGEKIEKVFKQSGMTKKAFAEKISKGRENIYDIFKRDSIDTDLLITIGKALNHNFFQYFIDDERKEPKEVPPVYQKPKRKAKVLIELELDDEDIIQMGLKDKVLQVLTK